MYNWFNKFPVFDIGDIVLRELSTNDAENYYEYMSRPEMMEFLTDANRPANFMQAIEEIKYWTSLFTSRRSFYWAIAWQGSNQLIGTAGFNIISQQHLKAEISYDLDPDLWGRGIMSRSIVRILQFAYQDLKLARIQATVIQDNIKSIQLLERCGFVKEGSLKKFEIVNGAHKDYYMYARVM